MRIAEAIFAVEAAVQAREMTGRAADVEALGCEIAGRDSVVVYIWFASEAEPLMVFIDLANEDATEACCDALLAALWGTCTAAASVH